ncbi:hydroxyacid oxidase 2 isoform X2 [Mobula hypostoma]|uniref:hydroxyacid oxidase 2 isoform X2 n=1 Tax=Mobula hypostoma TaxID=723540 RepID=UPI002FC27550
MPLVCLPDFEMYAKEHLPKAIWEFYAAGADECCTRDDNLMAFKRIRLRPRMLRDVSITDTRTTIQGTEISFPIGIAPTAFHCLAWHDGEMSTARAAEAMNTCYIASTYATCSAEEISAAAPNGFRWFQLYVYPNHELSEQLVHRVEACGYKAIVLTVDVPYTGKRRNDIRNNFKLPPHLKVKNFDGVFEETTEDSLYGIPANSFDPSISWKDISWLRSLTRLPIIIKGILTKEDAELAVGHGVQGIIVSNHGGRQLDGGPATIDALSEIVKTVQGRVEIYLDGGIRTGSDVLKALALGARCVFIGRPVVWGLAYKGEEGVKEILQILNDEFRLSMALSESQGFEKYQTQEVLQMLEIQSNKHKVLGATLSRSGSISMERNKQSMFQVSCP